MTQGYNAFSYKDISNLLGIKTSSIHYYFPKKIDLGLATVQKYLNDAVKYKELCQNDCDTCLLQLDRYLEPFIEAASSLDKICLCMSLSAEIMTLPDDIKEKLNAYFTFQEDWLENILKEGKEQKEFIYKGCSVSISRQIFCSLQAALVVTRSKNDPNYFYQLTHFIKSELTV